MRAYTQGGSGFLLTCNGKSSFDSCTRFELIICRQANYLLSIIAPLGNDRLIFADECLDLIDISRKEKDYNSPQLDSIEKAMLAIRDELRALPAPELNTTATSEPADAVDEEADEH